MGWLVVEMKRDPTRATTTAITIAATVNGLCRGIAFGEDIVDAAVLGADVPRSPRSTFPR